MFASLLRSSTAFASDEHLKAWLIAVTINRCREIARSAWEQRVVLDDPLAAQNDCAIQPDEALLLDHLV